MGMFCHNLFYPFGSGCEIRWLDGAINLVPDFLHHIGAEVVGNALMFLPFGVLYPLSQEEQTWKRSMLAGFATVAAIEVVQPVFGRAPDVNDMIFNALGVLTSASAFMGIRRRLAGKENPTYENHRSDQIG